MQARRITRQKLLLLVASAFAIRFVVVLFTCRSLPLSADHNEFGWEQGWIARSIYMGHGFSSPYQPLDGAPTALVAPLYPYLLAFIFKLFGLYTNASALVALGFNALISAGVVVPVFLLARRSVPHLALRLSRNPPSAGVAALLTDPVWSARVPWIAATLWALYPFSVYYSGAYLWDCTLTGALFAWTFLIGLSLRELQARGWALWGLLYGTTALCNPCVLSLFPVIVLIQTIGRGTTVRQGLKRIALAGTLLVAVLLPWTVRNIRVMHAPVPMRDGYWGEFFAGNTDDTSHTNPGWTHPGSNPVELQRYQQLGEVRYMAERQDQAMRHVSAHPGMFAVATARRIVRFWTGFWSFSSSYLADEALDVPNVPFCIALTLLLLLGMRLLARQHRRLGLCFLAVLLVFPLPYYLTHASMDYRQPIEPELVVLVAIGGAEIARRWQKRRAAVRARAEAAVLVAG